MLVPKIEKTNPSPLRCVIHDDVCLFSASRRGRQHRNRNTVDLENRRELNLSPAGASTKTRHYALNALYALRVAHIITIIVTHNTALVCVYIYVCMYMYVPTFILAVRCERTRGRFFDVQLTIEYYDKCIKLCTRASAPETLNFFMDVRNIISSGANASRPAAWAVILFGDGFVF